MNRQFYFKGMEPSFKLRFQANLVLCRILDDAPYGAAGFGILEQQEGGGFRSSLDIQSPYGPFMASAVHSTPERALEEMESKIKNQLDWWKSHRSRSTVPTGMTSGEHFQRAVS